MTQIYFNKNNTIMQALSILAVLILPLSLFSQRAIVGYADGNKHVNANNNNVTRFPTHAQLDRLTHVIAVGLGVNDDPPGTLKTTDLPGNWNGNTNLLIIHELNTLKAT